MYQFQQRAIVRYGQFREYHEAQLRLNELARERGWVEARLLVPVAGRDNEYIVQFDYESYADFEREIGEFFSDAEVMKVFRSAAELVIEGSGNSELFQSAPTIQ
jgi:hypothetical protein